MRYIIFPLLIILSFVSGPLTVAKAEPAAPFGLTWGASVEDLKSSGINLQRRVSDKSGVRFAATKLPKALSDLGETVLSFGSDNKLHKIEAIGEDVTNDPAGTRLKVRYTALARALTGKYGKGVARHEIQEPWIRPNDFLNGIYRGSSHHYTDFTGENVTVRLTIRASRRGVSNYVLIFQHKKFLSSSGPLLDSDAL
jgi:hypothetical protein